MIKKTLVEHFDHTGAFMQLIVKYITALSIILHFSIGLGVDCVCNQETCLENNHQHVHSDHTSNHHDSKPPSNKNDCSLNKCKCAFVTISPLRIVTTRECLEKDLLMSVSSSTHSSFYAQHTPNDQCNSYADAIRLRAQVWII